MKIFKWMTAIVILFFTLVGYIMLQSQVPQLTRITIPVENLPAAREGFTILHLTDLHSARFGEGQEHIFKLPGDTQVDMVAVTGDMVDRRKKEIKPGLELVEKVSRLGPVFFVPGNHEPASGVYGEFRKALLERGVNVLEGREKAEVAGGITVSGPGAVDTTSSPEKTSIMLSHYPNVFSRAAGSGVDLVLAGHTHGGQVRLPLIGALYVPGQGKFPRYDAGLFCTEGTCMYVNRGLGTSEIPVRFLCRPEVALITLTGK